MDAIARTSELTELAHYDVPGFILEVVSYHVPMFGAGGGVMVAHHRLAVRDTITGFWAWAMHNFQRKVLSALV